MAHPESEFDAVTNCQKSILYPHLKSRLKGNERRVLDFGCGPGRFTADLAALVGECIGVDPIQALLDLAPASPRVTYRPIAEGAIPLEDSSTDVVWCCLVLGGLKDSVLSSSIREIQRVLRPGGLLFLVENTQEKADGPHWRFRSRRTYAALFVGIPLLEVACTYYDAGEEISVMTGRKATGSVALSTPA
jgi:SAM-dependent methyltransferase